jgi:hypothetical protein
MEALLLLIHSEWYPCPMGEGRENVRENSRGKSALCRIVRVLEASPQLSRCVARLPLIPNGINGREFAHFNPGHKIPGMAILGHDLLNCLVEERLFGTASGFAKRTPVKFAPTLSVNI